MNNCGIDLASKSSAICILGSNGEILFEGACPTDEDGFRQALKSWRTLHCVIEASPLSEWVARMLESLGHEVVVIDPRRAKAIITSKKKTDKLDARNLARMGRTGWYTQVHRKTEEARLLRSHLKARKGLIDAQRQQNNRIRGLLRAHGIKVGQVSSGRFEGHVDKLVRRKCPALITAIRPLLDLWVSIRESLTVMTKGVKQMAKQDATCQLLMSAPGVGPMVASAYVATIDDPSRFRRGAQVAAYLGLVPSIIQSGESEYRGRITKEGDRLLRWLLVEAAHVLLTRSGTDSALKRWGKRLEKREGSSKAKVAVARKLAIVLHRIWLTGEPYAT